MSSVVELFSVLLYVRDLEKSLRFYRDHLGLRQVGPPQDSVVVLIAGTSRVVLHVYQDGSWPVPGMKFDTGGHAVSFAVDDPDAWAKLLSSQGVRVVEGPLDQIWGRVVFVQDPDGRVVALIRPRTPAGGPQQDHRSARS